MTPAATSARVEKTWLKRSVAGAAGLFVAHAVGSDQVLVLAAAGAVAGLGGLGLVALFVPGVVRSQIVLCPAEEPVS